MTSIVKKDTPVTPNILGERSTFLLFVLISKNIFEDKINKVDMPK